MLCKIKSLFIASYVGKLHCLMNIVTALLEYLDLVCNFLRGGGGGHLPQIPHPGSAIDAGIMLDAFGHLLCFKLCWHNRPVPTWFVLLLHSKVANLKTKSQKLFKCKKSDIIYRQSNILTIETFQV